MLTKLSTASRYGLRALKYLAQNPGYCSIQNISHDEKISKTYLEKIFSRLQKNGIVLANRGAQGGYALSKKPQAVTLSEILLVLENKPRAHCRLSDGLNCSCGSGQCAVGILENKLESLWIKTLEKITLKDLL